jgi:hypothetical protein
MYILRWKLKKTAIPLDNMMHADFKLFYPEKTCIRHQKIAITKFCYAFLSLN